MRGGTILVVAVALLSGRGFAWQAATDGAANVDAYHAVPILTRLITELEADPRTSPARQSEAWRELGYAYFLLRRYSNAEQAYTKALELQMECVPPDPVLVARLESSLGTLYQTEHRLSAARQAFQQALASLSGAAAGPQVRANLLNNIGVLERELGRHAEAETNYREALGLLDLVKDPDAVTMGRLLNNLALERMYRRDYAEASSLFSRALPIIENAGADFPPYDAETLLRQYAVCLAKMGQRKAALEMRNKARQIAPPADSLLIDASQLHTGRK